MLAQNRLPILFEHYRRCISERDDRLFLEFLPQGYTAMTLSSVPSAFRESLLLAKIRLGMFITLIDDFADNPVRCRPAFVRLLHCVPFHWGEIGRGFFTNDERTILGLARSLCEGITDTLSDLPHFDALFPVFRFDFEQCLVANEFSCLLTQCPSMANTYESRIYGPHNMGMILIGMMDLMACQDFKLEELGKIRRLLSLGQRVGRICNVLTTMDREARENDSTNELLIASAESQGLIGVSPRQRLVHERRMLLRQIGAMENGITSFSVASYVEGLRTLQTLHETLEKHL